MGGKVSLALDSHEKGMDDDEEHDTTAHGENEYVRTRAGD